MVARRLDWESKSMYNLTVQVTDGLSYDNCTVSNKRCFVLVLKLAPKWLIHFDIFASSVVRINSEIKFIGTA